MPKLLSKNPQFQFYIFFTSAYYVKIVNTCLNFCKVLFEILKLRFMKPKF